MAQNLRIIPETKDYELASGSPIPSDRIHEDVYFALMIPAGQWLHGEPDQGSELYKLYGAKRTSQTESLFATYARDAIERQVIAKGRARAVTIYNLSNPRFGSSNEIDVEPQVTDISSILNFRSV